METIKSDKVMLEKGLYYKQIRQYLKYFPKNNTKILIFEETIKEPLNNLRSLFKFLGINPDFLPADFTKNINPSSICPDPLHLLVWLNLYGGTIRHLGLGWLICKCRQISQPPESYDNSSP